MECSALPSSGGRGHSCDHQAMPLIETIGYWPSPFPRGKLGVSLGAVSSKAPEQAINGPSGLHQLKRGVAILREH